MAQTYQMKHNAQGTIYSLLTVESDGRMTITFHGTDREICHEVTENADGWLCYPGGMFPGLESGKWVLTDDVRCKTEEVRGKMDDVRGLTDDVVGTTDNTDCTDNEPAIVADEPLTMNPEPLTINQPRPRRQRKPRKPRVEHQPIPADAPTRSLSDIEHQPSDIEHQPSSTLKAIGMVAAATVALFVIYETGLLIPLGLIGLATGGILK